ncbi:hypothetical protein PHYBLDRAFT_188825 [Phycomyces blakesleeanus NRRL 1555(-)]|uniref:Protein kinase domain-containing protein n=2 Tax=Phycomyces blakesleeanus TaxID=4837 RepID=A0A162TLR6_PHYB8|nr:hypothetical protein PHYBLDRAFT_188825 [Phycomyces blakesleeanus NRRL 1555(-)]OAD68143.1 hypothetical protein PHYBLDRAFT_188825 [Phycomyces blakesleeanus NRRL 1555(-)]|eukprot:XP_018286183.1 hypothetical protein PHYBLDRAFT_188825 [Phycomyces blakesleeanus NRRL 1555(-)]
MAPYGQKGTTIDGGDWDSLILYIDIYIHIYIYIFMDDQELEQLYTRQLGDAIKHQTQQAIAILVRQYSSEFGLKALIPPNKEDGNLSNALSSLYAEITQLYTNNALIFDNHLHWDTLWRQELSFKVLSKQYTADAVIEASLPRARKAVCQIFHEELDPFMQWFPWSWFSSMQFIGAGGFSAVYAAQLAPPYVSQSSQIALKVVDDKLLNEITVQSRAYLPLLFKGLTVCESTGDLMMVMKLSNGGNLEDHMHQLPLGDLDLKTITGTMLRLAVNLADLHKTETCHRNVHPRNIICTDSDYFLVDYRFATHAHESSYVTALTKVVYGRPPYIAPEVRQGIYTKKSDVYSLGVIFWQLVSKVIFPSPDILLDRRQPPDHIYRIEPVPGVPEWFGDLCKACLEPLPENRPDAGELCDALQAIHAAMDFSVPLVPQVTEYIIARRAETANHMRMCLDLKGAVSTTQLFTLTQLPSTTHLVLLKFTNKPFALVRQTLKS